MRKKRQAHDKVVDRHKNIDLNFDDFAMKFGSSNSSHSDSSRKRKNSGDDDGNLEIQVAKPKEAKSVRDEEHYIPYRPKNFNTEKA